MRSTMARKKSDKPAEPAADRHKNKVVSFRPPEEVRGLLRDLARKERRTVAQIVQFMVEDALIERGLWTRQEASEE